MGSPEEEVLGAKREWLVRCTDDGNRPAVCSIGVAHGTVEVWTPNGDVIKLADTELTDFRDGVAAAVERATRDLVQSA
jgi:hypothetical protein